MKSMFLSSKKVVGCLTYVSHPTGQLCQPMMFTGDFQCCHYKICYFIVSKSNKYLEDVSKTINVLTSQTFEGICPYFILYHVLDEHTQCDCVTCSSQVSWTKVVHSCWRCFWFVITWCYYFILWFYMYPHVLFFWFFFFFLPSAIQLGISLFRVFSSEIKFVRCPDVSPWILWKLCCKIFSFIHLLDIVRNRLF